MFDRGNQVTDFTVKGRCSQCGACCSDFLPLSKREIKAIRDYIEKNGIKEQRHNGLNVADFTCPFRDEANRKCLVYPVRPEICRAFMCNHTQEDIQKTKMKFHEQRNVCSMRYEFFESTETIDVIQMFVAKAFEKGE